MENIVLGKFGEKIASEHLIRKGYRIIEMNFRKRWGEIDIVALNPSTGSKQAILVFVEVKTRMETDFVSPEESITPWKIRTLIRTAQFYKSSHPNTPELLRIDFIGVVLDAGLRPIKINHVENISS